MNIKIESSELNSNDYPPHLNLLDIATGYSLIINNFPFDDDASKEIAKELMLNSNFAMQQSLNGAIGWPALENIGSAITQNFALHHAMVTIKEELPDSYASSYKGTGKFSSREFSVNDILKNVNLNASYTSRGKSVGEALSQSDNDIKDPRWIFSIYEGDRKIELGTNQFRGIPEVFEELKSMKKSPDLNTKGMIIVDRTSTSAESQSAVYFPNEKRLKHLPLKMTVSNEDQLTRIANKFIEQELNKEVKKEVTHDLTI
jgi:hypothetical protein